MNSPASSSTNKLSELLLMHQALQDHVEKLIEGNGELTQTNAAIEKKIQTMIQERDLWKRKEEIQKTLPALETNAEVEEVALRVLEKRIHVLEKRVSSVKARVRNVQEEERKRHKVLIEQSALIRDRFQASYVALQERKRINEKRQEKVNLNSTRLLDEMKSLEEEQLKYEGELKNLQQHISQLEGSCKSWMERISSIIRLRRTPIDLPRHASIHHTQQPDFTQENEGNSNSSSLFDNHFDVVRAYEKQTKNKIRY